MLFTMVKVFIYHRLCCIPTVVMSRQRSQVEFRSLQQGNNSLLMLSEVL